MFQDPGKPCYLDFAKSSGFTQMRLFEESFENLEYLPDCELVPHALEKLSYQLIIFDLRDSDFQTIVQMVEISEKRIDQSSRPS